MIFMAEASPTVLDEFFQLGQSETESPFLTESSRKWASHLSLKASLLAAFFLSLSFLLSFFPTTAAFSYFCLALVYFLAGIPSLIESLEDLVDLEINIDILMTLAAFSSVLIGSGMEGGLLLVLFALSGAMEEFVTDKAKGAISTLHQLSPTKACVVHSDGSILEKSVRDIEVGTKILIRSGQMVPLDGIVLEGTSSVNLVHLTGEAVPVTIKPGDDVPAGARNLEGALTMQVIRTSADSTISRIIQLVTQAQEERPLLQRWFDRLSRTYAITIMSLAGLFALSFPFLFSIPFLGVEGSIYRALAFLIAASPCALIIAIPIAYLSAIGVCARQGILLKGGVSLDALAKCRAVAFDKTGTLTTGSLNVVGIQALQEESRYALAVAYALEKNVVHPIAKAIVAHAQKQNVPVVPIEQFRSIAGYGLEAVATIEGRSCAVYIGNEEYILEKSPEAKREELVKQTRLAKERGELVTHLLLEQDLYLICFQDMPRKGVREMLQDLRRESLHLIMLTGDHEQNARAVAQELDIDEYHADLRPEEKLAFISHYATKQELAMIGDGINDAPALARATVGICMGKVGSTAAIDAADIVLLQDNIELLGWLFRKAHATQAIVKQNLLLATLAIVLASLPALAGWVPLWLAVIMHEGGTVLVGLNGLRLLRK